MRLCACWGRGLAASAAALLLCPSVVAAAGRWAPQDGVQLLQASVDAGRSGAALAAGEAEGHSHVLLFFSVGDSSKTRKLVVKNIDHFRGTPGLTADVYLAHYAMDRAKWKKELGYWYDKNVQFSAERPGLKFWLAKDLLITKEPPAPNVDINNYHFLWVLDEDALFHKTDLSLMFSLARESKSGIMTPAFKTVLPGRPPMLGELGDNDSVENDSHVVEMDKSRSTSSSDTDCQPGEPECTFQAPAHACLFRHTNFVEVPFALMQPEAFRDVIGRCKECMPSRDSTWGLNRVWCTYIAEGNSWGVHDACAILDAAPIVHMNSRAHPKYRVIRGHQYLPPHYKVLEQVHVALPSFWVEKPMAYTCKNK